MMDVAMGKWNVQFPRRQGDIARQVSESKEIKPAGGEKQRTKNQQNRSGDNQNLADLLHFRPPPGASDPAAPPRQPTSSSWLKK